MVEGAAAAFRSWARTPAEDAGFAHANQYWRWAHPPKREDGRIRCMWPHPPPPRGSPDICLPPGFAPACACSELLDSSLV